MATVDELSTYLATQGVATSDLIFENFMPDAPDQCLAIYTDGGSFSELGYGIAAGVKYENPVIQIVTRAASTAAETAESLAWSAYAALAKVQAQTLSGTQYLMVRPLQSPSPRPLGPDENHRPRVSFNCAVKKELS